MVGIIVAGHANFATGITSSVDLIMGAQPYYETIEFGDQSSLTELNHRFDVAIDNLGECTDIVILTDLFSGSPFNVALEKTLDNEKLHLFSGINLAMLMELIVNRLGDASYDRVVANLVETARLNIREFNKEEFLALQEDEASDDEL